MPTFPTFQKYQKFSAHTGWIPHPEPGPITTFLKSHRFTIKSGNTSDFWEILSEIQRIQWLYFWLWRIVRYSPHTMAIFLTFWEHHIQWLHFWLFEKYQESAVHNAAWEWRNRTPNATNSVLAALISIVIAQGVPRKRNYLYYLYYW